MRATRKKFSNLFNIREFVKIDKIYSQISNHSLTEQPPSNKMVVIQFLLIGAILFTGGS